MAIADDIVARITKSVANIINEPGTENPSPVRVTGLYAWTPPSNVSTDIKIYIGEDGCVYFVWKRGGFKLCGVGGSE